jgi:hypothetical protein
LLAIALIALIFGGVQSYRLKSEQAKGIACESDRSNFAATQTGNLLTIEGLRHDAQVQAESRRIEREATAKALADADVTAAKFTEQYNRVSSELETLYARDAHASAWGNGGVDAGVADKLPGGKR